MAFKFTAKNTRKGHNKTENLEYSREDASLLSITLIQILLLVLVAVSVRFGQNLLAVVLLGMILLGILGRIWARMTAQNLKVRLKTSKSRMFPGDQVVLSWQMKNEKLLPVLWTDVVQPLTEPVAMVPMEEDGALRIRNMTGDEKTHYRLTEGETGWMFRERCSMIGSWRTASFDTVWKAVKRGIYTLENTRVYTGDGFGMTRYRLDLESGSQKTYVIYPRIVPVYEERFLKNMWEGESGSRGILEDPSVIKLTRPYENTDSLKKINWRMLARGQNLTVNQYEVVSPHAIHFIFDGESFNASRGKSHKKEMEASLEVLASLLLRLAEKKMECGFSFPETDRLTAVNLFADGSGAGGDVTGEILYRMAAYQMRRPVLERNPETGKEEKLYFPSVLAEEGLLTGSQQVAKYYFVTFDEKTAAASSFLKKMEGKPLEVLTYEKLMKLKKGEG